MNKNKATIKREAEELVNNYFQKNVKKSKGIEKDNVECGMVRLVEEQFNVNSENIYTDVVSSSEKEFNVSSENAGTETSFIEKAETKLNADFIRTSERSIADQLAECFVQHNVPARASNEILRILKPVILTLPADVRTLKGTPRVAPLITIDGGKYVHYGIRDSLTDFVRYYNVQYDSLELNFNVDGLPISKSSGAQVWPILMNVSSSEAVFAIGVYEGYTKPKNLNQFLQKFVEELNELIVEGFQYCESYFIIKIGTIVCDAPAKAMIMRIKSHSGYFCCHKCTIRGERCMNKIIFKTSSNNVQTDEDFRNKSYLEHHSKLDNTVLELLPIDMVKQFPMDYMHVVLLGVMRMLLKAWSKDRKKPYSISSKKLRYLDIRLMKTRNEVPNEFNRKSRSIHEVDRWKATELRMFLLYTGPVVLRGILDIERYNHFLSLSLGINILLQNKDECINEAEKLLLNFVEKIQFLYNESFLSYNVHCLTHLVTVLLNMKIICKSSNAN